ncbi:MAG: hypothetical protein M3Q87_07315 [Actinomycetota bacterium]|nr:hypothetical protein [Actinomycetota bacterium]
MDIEKAVTDGLSTIASFVPKLVLFVVILLIGWLIAKALMKVVNGILEKVGFDNAVEKGGVKTALDKSQYDASDLVAKLAYYAVLLFTLQLAFGVFGPNPISELITQLIAFLPQIIVAIIIIVIASAIAKAAKDLIAAMLGALSYGNIVATAASVFIMFLGIVAALNQVGVATTVTTPVLVAILATVAGILIVGVGGGLVRPMSLRWGAWLDKAAAEGAKAKQQATSPTDAGQEVGEQYQQQAGDNGQPADDQAGATAYR